jgi:hypothetical protein
VLFLYEKLAAARDALAAIGAEPWPYADVALAAGGALADPADTVTVESLVSGGTKRMAERWPADDASADYELVTEDRPAAEQAAG